jgi:hypothetical protein
MGSLTGSSGKARKGLFVVTKPPPYFRAGDDIPESGLYHVFHAEHRTSHKAVLLQGQPFPRCKECLQDVHFELIMAVPELDTDPNFQSFRLYEIPHKKDIA